MAATLALAAASASGKAPARAADTASAPAAEGSSFSDAMQAQAPEGEARPSGPARSAGESTAASQPAARTVDGADAAGEGDTDAALDPGQVQTVLGLCEAAPMPAAASEADAAVLAQGVAPDAACLAQQALAAAPALPMPPPGDATAPEPLPDAAQQGPLEALGDLRTDAALQGRAIANDLATGRDALTGALDEAATIGEGATTTGANAAAGDPRVPQVARATEASAARAPELRAPPGTPAWTDELGSRVTWMLDAGEQVASLRLNPENLGPLDVRIAVREGETTVWFGAAHPETRAALEQSLPRLREMLGASGLALANAGVFSQTPRDPQRGFTAAALARASLEAGADGGMTGVTGVTRSGLVDLYA